jgi:Flp pilus assembly protein TadB
MGLLFSDSVGQIMLGVSIVMALLGFLWMYKIVDIEI